VTVIPLNSNDKNAQDFPFVGSLVNINTGASGSAVVIGDGSHIITARHVITHDGTQEGLVLEGANFVFTLEGEGFLVERVFANESSDVAILKLIKKAPCSIKLYNSEDSLNKDFYGVGFGKGSTMACSNLIIWDLPYGTKRIFKNTILGSRYEIRISNNKITLEKKLFFVLRESGNSFYKPIEGEGMHGPGDSGGGIFINNNGNMELVAIINSILPQSPIAGFVADLYYCKSWIESIVPNSFADKQSIKLKIDPSIVAGTAVFSVLCIKREQVYAIYTFTRRKKLTLLKSRRVA
jgi:hypothetical protein